MSRSELLKPQTVRVADVLVIGPTMIAGGWQLRRRSPLLAGALALMGAGTVVYNAVNYARHERRARAQRAASSAS